MTSRDVAGSVAVSFPTARTPMLRGHRTIPLLVIGITLAFMALVFFGLDGGIWRGRHTIGTVIALPAALLWALARIQLGASFSWRPEPRRLVTHGLYARLRHPLYLFSELATLGLIVFAGWWWMLLIFLVTTPLQVWRARKESRVLESAFGEEYRAYRKRSWL